MEQQVTPSIGFLGDVGVSPRGLMELARQAEAAGYAGAWMVEYEYDSFAFNQALLMATETLVVGSCIARYFARDPLLVAETSAVLDQLCPGRYAIGLGTGPMKRSGGQMAQQRWGGDPKRSTERMAEYLEVIRLAMTHPELKISYDGEFFQFQDVKMRVRPAGDVPLWLSAGGPKMAGVAGRLCEGVFVHMVDAEGTQRTREIAAAAAKDAGRDPDALQMGNLIPTCVHDDGEVAKRAMRAYLLDYYFHLPHYHKWLAELGYEDIANALRSIGHPGDTKLQVDEILADERTAAAADVISDALLQHLVIAGTPDECRAKLREVALDWGTDLPILYVYPPTGDWELGYRDAIAALAPQQSAVTS